MQILCSMAVSIALRPVAYPSAFFRMDLVLSLNTATVKKAQITGDNHRAHHSSGFTQFTFEYCAQAAQHAKPEVYLGILRIKVFCARLRVTFRLVVRKSIGKESLIEVINQKTSEKQQTTYTTNQNSICAVKERHSKLTGELTFKHKQLLLLEFEVRWKRKRT